MSPKSDSGEHTEHVSLTPGNTEYIKYNRPSVQLSPDALTTKETISILIPLGQILELHSSQAYFLNWCQIRQGKVLLVGGANFSMRVCAKVWYFIELTTGF
jgi:hypothetical protein